MLKNDLIAMHICTICMLQETKMMRINKWLIENLWYDDDFDWEYIPSTGSSRNSGGVLSILD